MKVYALLFVLFLGVQGRAQTVGTKVDSARPALELAALNPSATINPLLNVSATPEFSYVPDPIAPAHVVATPVTWKQESVDRVFDKKYLILFGITAALTITDIELTQHCMQAGTCHEANSFLYGTNPTRARMYGINIPLLGGQAIFSAWLKQRHPERNAWMISPVADSVGHGIGSITGAIR